MARLYLGTAKRQRDEFHAVARFHSEQNRMFAFAARIGEALANVGGRGHCFAADFENDVANLEAMFGGNATRVDRGDHHALIARTRHFAAGSQRKAELGQFAVRHLALILVWRCRGLFFWALQEPRQLH
jgi:hypothetical protein